MKKVILTYGTFDLFHVGHLNLLQRLKALGDCLIVGVSSDAFNESKGKKTIIKFEDRLKIVQSIKYVDMAISEDNWEQKISDIRNYNVSTFGIGDDWKGRFDHLNQYCDVVYLPRTDGISSTKLKNAIKTLDAEHIESLNQAFKLLSSIVVNFK
ncbi:adenylyltransferase/cytidyltransferase family protein [Pseudomonas denitrificans (nom. rej.)]|uniref:Adenylyltransferase/cytidyltransferase family protein n=1 Tax=Pseudomonas denitrificans TaxID=43306 RepID=A0A9X7MV59_PSEDE|nr:adenylyltransferase/cytidyltransferase family protein [Pseudomonas denitrificans (nom. rej.)]QEY70407.1 adenylyltransferase/cytidyltransferase family protein [Pseudomonas denitrificans (nom. rej.)]